MKIERKKAKFEPTVITLETEDEANYFFHLLNLPQSYLHEYAEDEGKQSAQNAAIYGDIYGKSIFERFKEFSYPKTTRRMTTS